jgi:hypothetical protein
MRVRAELERCEMSAQHFQLTHYAADGEFKPPSGNALSKTTWKRMEK